MNLDLLSEFRSRVRKINRAEVVEDVVTPVAVSDAKVFSVVRCFLPPAHEIPVFFNLTEHEAKNLVFRVLKSREIEQHGVRRAMYFDWRVTTI